MFELNLLPRTELCDEITPEGRIYHTPDGDLPSVTTVLGQYYDKSGLEEWKRRIGEEAAELISYQAKFNGNCLHRCLEKFLLNTGIKEEHSIDKMRFGPVSRKLQQNVKKVYGSEFPLYSSRLRTAGRTDAVVNWNDVTAILDLKTTNKYKSEKYIESYFVQAATYGTMLTEQFGIQVEKIIIIFSTSDFDCYYFEKEISDYAPLVNKIFIERRIDHNNKKHRSEYNTM